MKQIYDFEQAHPPVLNEHMLRTELKRRKVQRQTAWLALGSLLMLLCLSLIAIRLYAFNPLLSVACAIYVCIAITGGCVIALIFVQKRRSFIKC